VKPKTGWALVDKQGRLLIKDYRFPVYWLRKIAKREQENFPDCRIVRVVVNEVFVP